MSNRTPGAVINAMRKKGRTLRLQHRWFGPEWRLDDGSRVENEVAQMVIKNPEIVSVGDALPFGGNVPAQTWRYAEAEPED